MRTPLSVPVVVSKSPKILCQVAVALLARLAVRPKILFNIC